MADSESGDAEAPSSDRKAPNTQFLSRFLKGVEQGNKREIASNAARAAQQHLAAAGAASLRPSLHKAAARGIESVAKVALNSAEQQKRILCTALLKEVAQVFGYRLRLAHNGEPITTGAEDDAADSMPLQDMEADLGDPLPEAPTGSGARGPGGRPSRRKATPRVRLDFGISQRALFDIGVGEKRARAAPSAPALAPRVPAPKRARGAAGAWEQVPQSDPDEGADEGQAEEEGEKEEEGEGVEGSGEDEEELPGDEAAGSPEGWDPGAGEEDEEEDYVGLVDEEQEEEQQPTSEELAEEDGEEAEAGGELGQQAPAAAAAQSVFSRLGGGKRVPAKGAANPSRRPAIAAGVVVGRPTAAAKSAATPASSAALAGACESLGGRGPTNGGHASNGLQSRPAHAPRVHIRPAASAAAGAAELRNSAQRSGRPRAAAATNGHGRKAPAAAANGSSDPSVRRPAGGASLPRGLQGRLGLAGAAGVVAFGDLDSPRGEGPARAPVMAQASGAGAGVAPGRRPPASVFGAALSGLRRVRGSSEGEH